MGTLGLIAVVILFAMVINLRNKVSNLEKKLGEMIGKGVAQAATISPTPQPSAGLGVQATSPAPAISTIPQPSPVAASAGENKFISWLTENWLLKLGALLLLIGFGWLVSYAFLNNWIGPAGRIALGLAAGALILALGWWRMRSFIAQGSVFVALGATVILLTTYAARIIYDFFTPGSALALMFAVSALVAFLSGIYERKQLGIAAVALAGIAPILAHSPTTDNVALFSYLLVVVLGATWIVASKGFREIVLTAFIVVAIYSAPLLFGFSAGSMPTMLLFAYIFAAIFYLTNTIGLLRLVDKAAQADLIAAAGNALLLILWVYRAAPSEWQSLVLSGWAVAFIVGSYMIFKATQRKEPLLLYAAIGIGYIAAATAIELSGAALAIAYTLESAAVSLSLWAITRNVSVAQRSAFLLIGPALLSVTSVFSNEWQYGVFNKDFFVLAILSITFFSLAATFRKPALLANSEETKSGNSALFVFGSIYAYVLLWLSLHAALPQSPDLAVMISLLVYTVIGIYAYLSGVAKDNKAIRAYGGVLLAFVVGRLLIIDVWQMELTGKIITFFIIGALLMSTAFLGRKKKTEPPAVSPGVTT